MKSKISLFLMLLLAVFMPVVASAELFEEKVVYNATPGIDGVKGSIVPDRPWLPNVYYINRNSQVVELDNGNDSIEFISEFTGYPDGKYIYASIVAHRDGAEYQAFRLEKGTGSAYFPVAFEMRVVNGLYKVGMYDVWNGIWYNYTYADLTPSREVTAVTGKAEIYTDNASGTFFSYTHPFRISQVHGPAGWVSAIDALTYSYRVNGDHVGVLDLFEADGSLKMDMWAYPLS